MASLILDENAMARRNWAFLVHSANSHKSSRLVDGEHLDCQDVHWQVSVVLIGPGVLGIDHRVLSLSTEAQEGFNGPFYLRAEEMHAYAGLRLCAPRTQFSPHLQTAIPTMSPTCCSHSTQKIRETVKGGPFPDGYFESVQ